MANPSSSNSSDQDQWEVCNDNGFVYKRRRRLRPTADEPSASAAAAVAEAELKRRQRARKRKSLVSLREKYSRELDRWKTLSSSSFSAAATTEVGPTPLPVKIYPLPPSAASKPSHIDELLQQAEAQEAIIEKLSEMCDYVDSVCNAEEERFAKKLVDLPIWGSPKSLMGSLQSL